MNRCRGLLLVLVIVVFASGCGDDGDEAPADDPLSEVDVEALGDCGEGQAFPSDEEFREAVCGALAAMILVAQEGLEVEPEWNERISNAILDYANRDAALQELADVTEEMLDAG